jgi:hypothetical protein
MPQTVMEDRAWSCPKCQGICSCGKCRKNPTQKAYAPKGTLLGHDTRKVADIRSVESLVDFSKTNLGWLRGENDHNPHESERMKRLKKKAEEAKAREDVIDENYLDNDVEHVIGGGKQLEQDDHIDPLLRDHTMSFVPENGHVHYESPYAPMNPPANSGDGRYIAPQAVMYQGLDETHGRNDFDLTRPPEVSFLSALGSSAPTRAPEISEQGGSEADTLSQNRMMGIGFYKQGNGADKILYDPPNLGGTANGTQAIPPTPTANFAFSDILQPSTQTEAPERRNHGGEDDTEFFTSKRQKILTEAKKPKTVQDERQTNRSAPKPTPLRRPPRLSIGKPQTYQDLRDDAEPVSDSELITVKARNPKSKRKANSDADGVQRVSHRLRAIRPIRRIYSKRTTRGKDSCNTALPTAAKPSRSKSAWLARREAEENGTTPPTAISRGRDGLKAHADMSPSLGTSPSDDENDLDSLFGEGR